MSCIYPFSFPETDQQQLSCRDQVGSPPREFTKHDRSSRTTLSGFIGFKRAAFCRVIFMTLLVFAGFARRERIEFIRRSDSLQRVVRNKTDGTKDSVAGTFGNSTSSAAFNPTTCTTKPAADVVAHDVSRLTPRGGSWVSIEARD